MSSSIPSSVTSVTMSVPFMSNSVSSKESPRLTPTPFISASGMSGLLTSRNLVQDEKLAVATLATLQSGGASSSSTLIKQDLKWIIQSRRRAEGKSEIEVEFKKPVKDELTSEEVLKRSRRRELNRLAARRSRERGQLKKNQLVEEIGKLQSANRELIHLLGSLSNERESIIETLRLHMKQCKDYSEGPRAISGLSSSVLEKLGFKDGTFPLEKQESKESLSSSSSLPCTSELYICTTTPSDANQITIAGTYSPPLQSAKTTTQTLGVTQCSPPVVIGLSGKQLVFEEKSIAKVNPTPVTVAASTVTTVISTIIHNISPRNSTPSSSLSSPPRLNQILSTSSSSLSSSSSLTLVPPPSPLPPPPPPLSPSLYSSSSTVLPSETAEGNHYQEVFGAPFSPELRHMSTMATSPQHVGGFCRRKSIHTSLQSESPQSSQSPQHSSTSSSTSSDFRFIRPMSPVGRQGRMLERSYSFPSSQRDSRIEVTAGFCFTASLDTDSSSTRLPHPLETIAGSPSFVSSDSDVQDAPLDLVIRNKGSSHSKEDNRFSSFHRDDKQFMRRRSVDDAAYNTAYSHRTEQLNSNHRSATSDSVLNLTTELPHDHSV